MDNSSRIGCTAAAVTQQQAASLDNVATGPEWHGFGYLAAMPLEAAASQGGTCLTHHVLLLLLLLLLLCCGSPG
jgi:hypothetical protein